MLLSPMIGTLGKRLTQPLALLLLIILIAALLGFRKGANPRRSLFVILAAALLLWILATPAVSYALARSLAVPETSETPQVIVVLSGGWIPGTERETDSLSIASHERVVTGAAWWKRHADARLVLSGAEGTSTVGSRRVIELMRDEAVRRGVRPDAIVMEGRSLNTWQHPRELRALGYGPEIRVGVVTSAYHMRRALFSFRRYFPHVLPHPAAGDQSSRSGLIPTASSLRRSTEALHEWIGIAWYALLDALEADRMHGPAAERLQRRPQALRDGGAQP